MISATFLAIFFVPLFFVLIVRRFSRRRSGEKAEAGASGPEPATGSAS
jgi:hypothetical protein